MAFETLGDVNTSEGLHTIFVYANDVTGGMFINMLLFTLFVVTAMGHYYARERIGGGGDFAVSFAIAGYFVAGAAMLMLMIPELIGLTTVTISIGVAIMGTLWLFMSRSGR